MGSAASAVDAHDYARREAQRQGLAIARKRPHGVRVYALGMEVRGKDFVSKNVVFGLDLKPLLEEFAALSLKPVGIVLVEYLLLSACGVARRLRFVGMSLRSANRFARQMEEDAVQLALDSFPSRSDEVEYSGTSLRSETGSVHRGSVSEAPSDACAGAGAGARAGGDAGEEGGGEVASDTTALSETRAVDYGALQAPRRSQPRDIPFRGRSFSSAHLELRDESRGDRPMRGTSEHGVSLKPISPLSSS
jgi:hypothetical protein